MLIHLAVVFLAVVGNNKGFLINRVAITGSIYISNVFVALPTGGNSLDGPLPEECDSPACLSAVEHIRKMMDPTVDPCEDFYDFACGRFLNEVEIPSKEAMLLPSISNTLVKVQSELKQLISEPISPTDATPIAMAKQYFADCMDLEKREQEGSEKLLSLIENIGGWPLLDAKSETRPVKKWWQMAVDFAEAGIRGDWLVHVIVEDDMRQPDSRAIYVRMI